MENSKNRHGGIFESYEYFTFSGDICGFFLHYTMFIYTLLPGFWGYFAFFLARKKAINIILVDLETSKRGLQLWFFLFLDHFLLWQDGNLVMSKRNQ